MTLSFLLILAVVFSVGLCVGMVIMEVWSSWHDRPTDHKAHDVLEDI